MSSMMVMRTPLKRTKDEQPGCKSQPGNGPIENNPAAREKTEHSRIVAPGLRGAGNHSPCRYIPPFANAILHIVPQYDGRSAHATSVWTPFRNVTAVDCGVRPRA